MYTYAATLAVVAFLLVSTAADAQRRYQPRRGGYYYRPPVARYYAPPRVYSYTHPFASIGFGGIHYRYQRGYFYRPAGVSFQIVAPPVGIRVATLPVGYRRVMIGPNPYYYYNDIYYRAYDDQYEVVAPPLGATVDQLPPGTQVKVIDGQKYHELNGTYYQEEATRDGHRSYRVAGTDGVLDTRQADDHYAEPEIGDRFDDLPADARTVTVQGEKLYLAPSGLYYKEVTEGNRIVYEVVGK